LIFQHRVRCANSGDYDVGVSSHLDLWLPALPLVRMLPLKALTGLPSTMVSIILLTQFILMPKRFCIEELRWN
jgi:hypothetical protein